MNLNKSTALTLRIGVVIGMSLIVIGLCADMLGKGDSLLYWGMLVLIVSPFLSILVSFASLVSEKDWTWAVVAAVLIAITAAGIVLSL